MKTFKQFQEQLKPSPLFKFPVKSSASDRNVQTSSYGPGLYGNPTASGQTLTPTTRGVAHKTLPLGAKVRLTDPSTGKSTVTSVIDRGPYHGNREFDLTTQTTKDLGYKDYKQFGARELKVGKVEAEKPSSVYKFPTIYGR